MRPITLYIWVVFCKQHACGEYINYNITVIGILKNPIYLVNKPLHKSYSENFTTNIYNQSESQQLSSKSLKKK